MVAITFRTIRQVKKHVCFVGWVPFRLATQIAVAEGKELLVCSLNLYVMLPCNSWHNTGWVWHRERQCFLDREGKVVEP